MDKGGACQGCGPIEDWTSPMNGNSTNRFRNTAVLAVQTADASRVISSDALDEALADTYSRVGLRPGLLERLAGIRERRWWADGVTFIEGAAMAGAKAISESGVDPAAIGVMINTSISRKYLEPSTAVAVHDALGLPRSCQNFDVTNACLGFVNGMEIAAAMIDSGFVEYALIVNGEDAQPVQERTIDRLSSPDTASRDVLSQFATLTLGSGAVAMVLGRADSHPEGHRLVGSVEPGGDGAPRAVHRGQRHDADRPQGTPRRRPRPLPADVGGRRGGLRLAQGMARYVIHQVSKVHIQAICERLGIDPALVPDQFPTRGNLGPASVPFTLAGEQDSLVGGDRVLLMGIGSGLNASCLEIAW